ncbi:hypothetical protein IAR55_002234 [Kwoniella newhampshirensis]|uniref:Uncharacterized protein n=1 Tax=Kwoniella newhampshirensis TaxID=1651941 RepID=A0AAW0Z0D1_9TREE
MKVVHSPPRFPVLKETRPQRESENPKICPAVASQHFFEAPLPVNVKVEHHPEEVGCIRPSGTSRSHLAVTDQDIKSEPGGNISPKQPKSLVANERKCLPQSSRMTSLDPPMNSVPQRTTIQETRPSEHTAQVQPFPWEELIQEFLRNEEAEKENQELQKPLEFALDTGTGRVVGRKRSHTRKPTLQDKAPKPKRPRYNKGNQVSMAKELPVPTSDLQEQATGRRELPNRLVTLRAISPTIDPATLESSTKTPQQSWLHPAPSPSTSMFLPVDMFEAEFEFEARLGTLCDLTTDRTRELEEAQATSRQSGRLVPRRLTDLRSSQVTRERQRLFEWLQATMTPPTQSLTTMTGFPPARQPLDQWGPIRSPVQWNSGLQVPRDISMIGWTYEKLQRRVQDPNASLDTLLISIAEWCTEVPIVPIKDRNLLANAQKQIEEIDVLQAQYEDLKTICQAIREVCIRAFGTLAKH